jgi:hypothetical protein
LRIRLVASLVAVLLVFRGINPGFGYVGEDEQWPIPNEFGLGHHSVLIEDPVSGLTHSQLTGHFENNTYLCASLNDPRCEKAAFFNYDILLPVCSEKHAIDCIRSIEAVHPDGRVDSGTFKRYTHDSHPNSFIGSAARGIPNPEMPSLWEFADSRHEFGNQYGIAVGMSGRLGKLEAKGIHRDFFINLHPVSLKVGSGKNYDVNNFANYSKCIQFLDSLTGRSYLGCGGGAEDFGNYRCAFKLGENGNCLLRHAFPTGVKFRITVDLTTEPSGWFHGRMKDPDVKIEELSSGGIRLSVEAEATKQPVFYWGKDFSSMSAEQKQIWNECVPKFQCFSATRLARSNPDREPDGSRRNVQFTPRPTGEPLIDFMSKFLVDSRDKATVVPSAWNLRALSTNEMAKAAQCFLQGSGVKGIVTTNATVYSEGPPSFDGTMLQYRVAAPHFTPEGEEFRGSYNLVMRSEVARCLYGFSDAPISASIEVIGDDGEKSVATTIVGERSGWLYLAAHNFTFSSPTIKAKISQIPTLVTPSPTPVVAVVGETTTTVTTEMTTIKKKSVIRCFKGVKTKRVVAVRPKCPNGWRRA